MPAPAPRPVVDAAVLVAVALGGALGAAVRYLIAEWQGLTGALDVGWGGPADAILAINVVGAFLMGLLICWGLRRRPHRLARPFLGTGVLGGFTTFSTFSFDVQSWPSAGDHLAAVTYFLATPFLTVAACWLGVQTLHRLLGRALPDASEAGDL